MWYNAGGAAYGQVKFCFTLQFPPFEARDGFLNKRRSSYQGTYTGYSVADRRDKEFLH